MKKNQEGFGLITILLAVLAMSVIGFTGWLVVKFNSSNNNPQPAIIPAPDQQPALPSQPQPITNNSTAPIPSDGCATGRIIVFFKDGTSKTRQQEIINAEKATIIREYDQFNGYALNVGLGQEISKVKAFLNYPEVKTSTPEGCPVPANSGGPSNQQ